MYARQLKKILPLIGITTTLILITSSCNSVYDDKLFQLLSSGKTNITFENTLTESDTFNYFLFPYIYMGAGVSVGDFNNDGFTDIYFTGNMVSNRLYLNNGDLSFRDVTDASNTGGDNRWMLGTTICDINNDGLLDIYVSVSGLESNTENLLFVNQGINNEGIPIFNEEAKKYGLNDPGLSTQSVFFDYDNDGDLDLYVANYPITNFKSPAFFYKQMMRNAKLDDSGHLYRNNNDGTFTNVTKESGLLSFGLSLSVTIGDLNNDGYKDIYISNDFLSPDFFFFNNGDGTFIDKSDEVIRQTSHYGMGADAADYNNDGFLDIIQIDMAPEDNKRAKENMSSARLEDFEDMVKEGLHYQYKYSTLYLNRGLVKDSMPFFNNAGWLAGVTQTDWSWAGLFADFDLDGWKDLYITNGSRRDMNNSDYFNKIATHDYFTKGEKKSELVDLVKKMPTQPMNNYMFRNNGDLTFARTNKMWGMTETSYSNGVAYADLDNDGDLELIVNNIDQEAFIYKNNAIETKTGNYLKVKFEGTVANKMGIGSIVNIWCNGKRQMAELTLSRGYESSVEPYLYFGLNKSANIDSLRVEWSDSKTQVLKNIKVNQKITLRYSEAETQVFQEIKQNKLFEDITDIVNFSFIHKENAYNDYNKQVLLPHKMSYLGPGLSVGDVNNDNLQDFYIGNATRSKGNLFVQNKDGNFEIKSGPWENDKIYEDMGSLLFDADNDGDLDLYVVSGGNEFPENSNQYNDRFYINNGNGNFSKLENVIPEITSSGSCVKPIDFDNDGDLDLFIGGRHLPGKYPFPAKSFILENKTHNENIKFEDATASVAPDISEPGMVTSAFCGDIDIDGWTDLIIAGEWMPICIYKNINGRFEKNIINETAGWWFCIDGADFDKDGDIDLVGGNLGLNFRYKASNVNTFDIYASDFDKDGKSDIVLSYYQNGKQYTLRGRECFVDQNPGIARLFPTYESFAKAKVSDIYTNKSLNKALHYKAENFASCYFENIGNSEFIIHEFPNEAQLSSINDLVIEDFDNDGNLDILAAGNLFEVEVVTPRNDAGVGVYLKGDGKGNFNLIPPLKSGFFAPHNVKSLSSVSVPDKKIILVGNNDDKLQIFKCK